MTDPVVIAAFRARAEAVAASDALAASGTDALVSVRSDACPRLCEDLFEGGFDLIVDRADAAAAMEIVRRLWPEEPGPERVVRCPACRSDSIARLPRLRLFLAVAGLLVVAGELTGQRELFVLVIGIVAVLFLIAKPMRCRECGERWRGEPAVMDEPVESPPVICPRCGSEETEIIPRRRERAWTLLVNYVLPPLILVWPFRPKRRCATCGQEWR